MPAHLRHALRSLLRTPWFSATAICVLGLCLGANLVIFAVFDAVLLRPLPFSDADRLITIYNSYPRANVDNDGASVANYYERRGNVTALAQVALHRPGEAIIGQPGTTELLPVARVTPEFFATLGVRPALGRSFTDAELDYGADDVVVLTHAFWRQQFDADPRVLGRTLRIDGQSRRIVGVLPAEFSYLSNPAVVYLPLSSSPDQRQSRNRHWGNAISMIARLAPGVSLVAARNALDRQDRVLEQHDPEATLMAEAGFHSVAVPLGAYHVRFVRPILVLLMVGALLLLGIGAANVINLLLIRATRRAREFAIRQSLGATRRDVVVATVAETLLLAICGLALGWWLAVYGLDLVRGLGCDLFPPGSRSELRPALLAPAAVATVGLGVLLAIPVGWLTLRTHLAAALQSSARTTGGGRGVERLRQSFITLQIALAFVLLAGASVLTASVRRLAATSPGFAVGHLLTARVSLPWTAYPDAAARERFADRLLEAVRSRPEVRYLGLSTKLPLGGADVKSGVRVTGHTLRPGESVRAHYAYGVTGDYFPALGIPLRAGRFMTAADSHGSNRVCVVDDAFARLYWPDGSALGHTLTQGSADTSEAFTVVGVVGAVKQTDVNDPASQGTVYFPFARHDDGAVFIAVRTSLPAASFAPVLRALVRQVDPELPLADVTTMSERVDDSLQQRRSPARLALVFGALALLLATLGTYGTLSFAVAQREREIGVRVALGASPGQLAALFLRRGCALVCAGLGIGAVAALIVTRTMHALLPDLAAIPVLPVSLAAGVLAAVSLAASLLPACRAARVDPVVALRAE